MRSLFLVSGGLDSTAGIYRFKEMDFDCLFFNYGQRSFRVQSFYAEKNCRRLNKKFMKIDLQNLGNYFSAGKWMRPHEPITHRNSVIIPIALAFASENGYESVYSFLVNEECRYETNKPMIISSLRELARSLRVNLVFPFLGLSKSFVLKLGLQAGMDAKMTYSCILGHKYHCGKCSQCELRKLAFIEAGLKDPTLYQVI
jgi:Predicted PP-loop superfamily ATPase